MYQGGFYPNRKVSARKVDHRNSFQATCSSEKTLQQASFLKDGGSSAKLLKTGGAGRTAQSSWSKKTVSRRESRQVFPGQEPRAVEGHSEPASIRVYTLLFGQGLVKVVFLASASRATGAPQRQLVWCRGIRSEMSSTLRGAKKPKVRRKELVPSCMQITYSRVRLEFCVVKSSRTQRRSHGSGT